MCKLCGDLWWLQIFQEFCCFEKQTNKQKKRLNKDILSCNSLTYSTLWKVSSGRVNENDNLQPSIRIPLKELMDALKERFENKQHGFPSFHPFYSHGAQSNGTGFVYFWNPLPRQTSGHAPERTHPLWKALN